MSKLGLIHTVCDDRLDSYSCAAKHALYFLVAKTFQGSRHSGESLTSKLNVCAPQALSYPTIIILLLICMVSMIRGTVSVMFADL